MIWMHSVIYAVGVTYCSMCRVVTVGVDEQVYLEMEKGKEESEKERQREGLGLGCLDIRRDRRKKGEE